jgi:hypothetical protein
VLFYKKKETFIQSEFTNEVKNESEVDVQSCVLSEIHTIRNPASMPPADHDPELDNSKPTLIDPEFCNSKSTIIRRTERKLEYICACT